MAAVSVDELAARYPGGIPEADRPRATAALEDAETAVRVAAALQDAEDVPRALVPLVLRVARREYANPLGRGSETLADFTWRTDGRSPGAALTEDERAEVRRAMGYGDAVSVHTPHTWTATDVQRITPTTADRWSLWPNGGRT
ncbi:hypothetical protein [Nocardiopsis alba]|uniref:hypothetical protein n=1 Tax=Nocardiopsis alba TaxID=53437 RepID=UPI003D750438